MSEVAAATTASKRSVQAAPAGATRRHAKRVDGAGQDEVELGTPGEHRLGEEQIGAGGCRAVGDLGTGRVEGGGDGLGHGRLVGEARIAGAAIDDDVRRWQRVEQAGRHRHAVGLQCRDGVAGSAALQGLCCKRSGQGGEGLGGVVVATQDQRQAHALQPVVRVGGIGGGECGRCQPLGQRRLALGLGEQGRRGLLGEAAITAAGEADRQCLIEVGGLATGQPKRLEGTRPALAVRPLDRARRRGLQRLDRSSGRCHGTALQQCECQEPAHRAALLLATEHLVIEAGPGEVDGGEGPASGECGLDPVDLARQPRLERGRGGGLRRHGSLACCRERLSCRPPRLRLCRVPGTAGWPPGRGRR